MNPIQQQLAAEASRRFGGMGASPAGLSPNPSASGTIQPTTPANPLSTQVSQPTGGSPTNPLQGGATAMKNAMPGEVKFILKAFKDRLEKHPVSTV